MATWYLRSTLLVEEEPDALDKAYGREVRWTQGFRVNMDSRLLLLGLRRFLNANQLSESDLHSAEYVLGCRFGAMDSYEKFDASLAAGIPAPLAFAYALPSMPLACASVCYGLRGHTYTVVGQADVGIRAFRQAIALLGAGRTQRVIFGCWESPSATAGHPPEKHKCRLLLGMVEMADQSCNQDHAISSKAGGDANPDCVETLANFLQTWRNQPALGMCHG